VASGFYFHHTFSTRRKILKGSLAPLYAHQNTTPDQHVSQIVLSV